jgi:hypothetical protein
MRKGTAIAIALVTLVVVGLLGFGISREFFRAKLLAYEMSSVETMSTYVGVTRFMGTSEAYESALQDLLAAIDAREKAKVSGGLLSPRAVSVEKALTYVRLALLATERGDHGAAAKYWSQAQALCPQIGWTSCPVDRLTDVVRKLDDHSIWNPKGRSVPNHGS